MLSAFTYIIIVHCQTQFDLLFSIIMNSVVTYSVLYENLTCSTSTWLNSHGKTWKMDINGPGKSWKTTFSVLYAPCTCCGHSSSVSWWNLWVLLACQPDAHWHARRSCQCSANSIRPTVPVNASQHLQSAVFLSHTFEDICMYFSQKKHLSANADFVIFVCWYCEVDYVLMSSTDLKWTRHLK